MSEKSSVIAPADALQGKKKKLTVRSFLLKYNAILILVILFIAASLISDIFLTKVNMNTVMRQQTTYLIVGMGMLMVIITGGIDLAAAVNIALSTILMVVAAERWGFGSFGCISVALLTGLAIGCFNGFFVSVLRIPSFIVTLAFSYIGEGICFMITNGNTLMLKSSGAVYKLLTDGIASMSIPGINFPFLAIFAVVIVIIFYFVMKYTKFGRLVYAVGSNEKAVLVAGISSKKILFLVYLIEGFLCSIAAVLLVARTGSASALTCSGDYSLSCIAAVVIGGASLAGGEGTVVMTVVGVFIIAIIGNVMNLVGLPSYPQMVVKGAIIIFAVILKGISSRQRG